MQIDRHRESSAPPIGEILAVAGLILGEDQATRQRIFRFLIHNARRSGKRRVADGKRHCRSATRIFHPIGRMVACKQVDCMVVQRKPDFNRMRLARYTPAGRQIAEIEVRQRAQVVRRIVDFIKV